LIFGRLLPSRYRPHCILYGVCCGHSLRSPLLSAGPVGSNHTARQNPPRDRPLFTIESILKGL
jgi:hypothetical protein